MRTEGNSNGITRILLMSIATVTILSLGLYLSNEPLILVALLAFSLLLIFSDKGLLLPLLLFFLPWSPVLKMSPGSFTFFTLVMPIVFIVILFKNRNIKIKMSNLIIVSLFAAYTMFVKLAENTIIDTSYLYFVFLMLFIPIYINDYKNKINFEKSVLFMTGGLLSACLASTLLMNIPHMAEYIDVYKRASVGLTRFSGFYGDPNFYSAQIIMAIASLLTVLSKTKKRLYMFLQVISILALIFFGVMSVSKMFLLSLTAIIAIWLFATLFENRSSLFKIGVFASVMIVLTIVFFTNAFSSQVAQYVFRFTNGDITSGRENIQSMYIQYFSQHTDTFVFGNGLGKFLLNARNAHNTFLQIIWQIGFIGGALLYFWHRMAYSQILMKSSQGIANKTLILMLYLAYLLPWFALDYLYFDEIFYFLFFVFLGRRYLADSNLTPNHSIRRTGLIANTQH